MKTFWSWQSDHPGRVSRHFVREALEQAIASLNADLEVEDAARPDVTLDHDRKGVPGSPDLATTIFEKIKTSQVFVADVTPVGRTPGKPAKKLINGNVAIELGFALATVTDSGLIMVLNEHYGRHEDLPFDLRHKAGPVVYRLAPDARSEEIAAQKSQLVGRLKLELRAMLSTRTTTPKIRREQIASIVGNPARYFDRDAVLAQSSAFRGGTQTFTVPQKALLYLRVIPSQDLPRLSRPDARDLVHQARGLEPFYFHPSSRSIEQNEQGVITFNANSDEGKILCATQLFLNREIWAFDAVMLEPRNDWKPGLLTLSIEQTYARCLPAYLDFATQKLRLKPPFQIEAGASGIKGYVIYMPSNYLRQEWGPILEDPLWRGDLAGTGAAEVDKVLLDIFERFFEAGGERRPLGLHSFPGNTAGEPPR